MTTPCVVLCSEVKATELKTDGELKDARVTELTALFTPIHRPLDDVYEVRDYSQRSTDGGNGGGGEGAAKLPKFIYGSANVGAWNFRYCRDVPDKSISTVRFPSAARIEVCAYFTDVGAARLALAEPRYSPLHEIFENVLIVPLSKPANNSGGFVVDSADKNIEVDVSTKGSQ